MCRGVAGKSYHPIFNAIHSVVPGRSQPIDEAEMSYQVLARKWRPSNFSQVAGQAHVLKSLINALDNERLHHAYLFTGTRGVGKTTLARILAKCLNCEAGISATPCETCDSCREISEGRFIDLIEVDAASRTKVEDTRELLENVQYTPSRGRFKVYLIDEVHMLSAHSFNALLKTLEEPPPHVKFLFATTDPQKLPITVLSRCLQFNLKNLSPNLITEYLVSILEQEKIECEEDALWQIAAAASGSMRDALTLVDQAISYCQGAITAAGVVEMLGIPESQKVFRLLDKMSSGDVKDVFLLLGELAEHTPDYAQTLDSLMSVLHRVAMAQVLPDAIDNSSGDKATIQELAASLTAEDVQLFYQLGIKGREDLRLASDARSAFEMLLLRMMVFSPNFVALGQAQDAADASGQSGAAAGEKKKPEAVEAESAPAAATEATPVTEPAPTPEPERESKPVPVTTAVADPEAMVQAAPVAVALTPVPPASHKKPVIDKAPASATSGREAASANPAQPMTLSELTHERWLEAYRQLEIAGIAANVLANSALKGVAGNEVQFILDEAQSAVFSEEILPKLGQVMSAFFQCDVTVRIEVGIIDKETPAMLSQRLKKERHIAMVDEFEHDENVQELLKHFSGTLAKDTIAPSQAEKNND